MGEVKKVFMVEDDRNFGTVMKAYLEINGFLVTWVKDGMLAYKRFSESVFDICVLDVMLPNIDGFTIARQIKDTQPDIPIVFLTAKVMKEDVLEGFRTGADDYITKPFDLDLLFFRIQHLVEKQLKVQSQFQKNVEIAPSMVEITSLDEKLIKKAINYVEKNISESKFSVEDLSRELGMSRVYLYKKLMAITGKSPVEFIRIIRLKRGAQLLEKSQLNVSEIAYEVGFNSPRYFSKYFKEEYGMLPTAYVKSKSNEKIK